MKKTMLSAGAVLITALFLYSAVILAGCGTAQGEKEKPMLERTFIIMGASTATFKVVLDGIGKEDAEKAIGKAYQRIRKIEKEISIFNKESEVSRLNSLGAGKEMKVSDDVFEIIEASVKFSEMSGGAFDVTCAPLIEIWQFGTFEPEDPKIPAKADIEKALKRVGYKNIILDKEKKAVSFKIDGVMMNFGGIGQGFMADKAVETLKENGVKNAIVDISGDIYCLGAGPDGKPWNVGIRHPRKRDEIACVTALQDMALTTSGDYEKYFIADGKRYSHTIDPKTGMPVPEHVISVSIIAADTLTCDGLDTAIFVMGAEKGLKLIESLKGVEAVIFTIDEKGKISTHLSSGLKDKIKIDL